MGVRPPLGRCAVTPWAALRACRVLPRFPRGVIIPVVEIRVGDRYKPDVVSLDGQGQPRFWGEAGRVGSAAIST